MGRSRFSILTLSFTKFEGEIFTHSATLRACPEEFEGVNYQDSQWLSDRFLLAVGEQYEATRIMDVGGWFSRPALGQIFLTAERKWVII